MLIDFNQTLIELIGKNQIPVPFPTDLNNKSLFLYILYSVAPTKLIIRTILRRSPQNRRRCSLRFHH